MAQETLSLSSVAPTVENWDAVLHAALTALIGALRRFSVAISYQGSISTPSIVNIQILDANGNALAQQFYLRVRVVNSGGYAVATNATITTLTGTLIQSLTASKDLIIQSNASGLIQLTCTDATIESFGILIGDYLNSPFADYNASVLVAHINTAALLNTLEQPVLNSLGGGITRT